MLNKKILILIVIIIVIIVLTVIFKSKKMIYPVKLVNIVSRFGERINPFNPEEKQFHNGVDFRGKTGVEVLAIHDGRVLKVYKTDHGGEQMTIKHSNGFISGMAHLSKIFKNEGDQVKQGEVVGLVGNTGRVTGSHLHFTLRNEKNNIVNPVLYLS